MNQKVILSAYTTLLQHSDLVEFIKSELRSFTPENATKSLRKIFSEAMDKLLVSITEELLYKDNFRDELRSLSSEKLRFHSIREITVQMPFGTHQKMKSDWYLRTGKAGLRKCGPKDKSSGRKGCYLFLEALGYQGRKAPEIVDKALQMSALCPSSEIASGLLKKDDITVSQNKIRHLVSEFKDLSDKEYADLACSGTETFKGKRLLLCVDGGRVNCRYNKKGRIPNDMKRHSYKTDWKEAKLFTVYVLNEDGSIDETVPPLVDGVIGYKDCLKSRLSAYLKKIEVSKCKDITIVCDGASWHWGDLKKMLTRNLKVPSARCSPVKSN